MDVIDERALVYMAVLFVCSALAVFAGPARAAATFGLVTASVKAPIGWAIRWLRGAGRRTSPAMRSKQGCMMMRKPGTGPNGRARQNDGRTDGWSASHGGLRHGHRRG